LILEISFIAFCITTTGPQKKILKPLLLSALHSNAHRHKEIIRDIKEVVNKVVIGRSEIHEQDLGGWRVLMKYYGKTLDDVNLSNTLAWKFVEKSIFES
jgi:hypothetical protein